MITKPSRYDGDPKIYIDENGADLRFAGGQPIMDAGLENAATISLFTGPGWWANDLFAKASEKIGSDFESTAAQPITATAFADTERAADVALRWLLEEGVAAGVTVEASNPSARRVAVAVLIEPPTGEVIELQALKNGLNWINQTIDPANRK